MASRATIAEQTLKVLERGNYITAAGKKPVELQKQLQFAIANTVLYTPAQKPKLLQYAKSRIEFDSTMALLKSAPYLRQDRNVDLPADLNALDLGDEVEEDSADTTTTTTTTTTDNATDNITTTNDNNNNNNNTNTAATDIKDTKEDSKDTPTKAEPVKPNKSTAATVTSPTRPIPDPKRETKTYQTKFEVIHCTTLEAACQLAFDGNHPKTCLLNFASAKNPGGGFLGGAQAQEESIARSSGLYPCLTSQPTYYQSNKRDPTCVYTDHIIYSPNVPVFRSDDGNLLEKPYFPSIISAPAVNWGAALHRVKDAGALVRTMKERAAMLLGIALHHDEDTLVLGAWGCGVFRFPPPVCAELFFSLLVPPSAPFFSLFKHVVFAILDKNMYELFKRVFAEGPEFLLAEGFAERALEKRGGGGGRGGKGGNERRGGGGGGNDKRGGRDNEKKGGNKEKNTQRR